MPDKRTLMNPSELAAGAAATLAVLAALYAAIRTTVLWVVGVNIDRKNLARDKANRNEVEDIRKDVADLMQTREKFPRVTVPQCLDIQKQIIKLQQHNSEMYGLRMKEGEKQFAAILSAQAEASKKQERHQEKVAEKQDEMLRMILKIYQMHGKWDGDDRRNGELDEQ